MELRLTTGATERITFTVPESSTLTGPTTVSLMAEGEIEVTPTQVVLDGMMREMSALVTATPGPAVGMEPRSSTAAISLSAASATEAPRLVPGEIIRILIERRRNPIEVHVDPVELRLAAGATERVTFTVPERFSLSGPTSVLLTIEGAIAVAPTQVVLDGMMRATSASVSMTPGSAVGMEPRSSTAAISLRAVSDTEDPRLIPDDVIRILVEKGRNPVEVLVEPTTLRLTAGATERITFTVPESSTLTGPTTVSLMAEGDIEVTPTQIVLNEMMRAASALVTATPGSAVGAEPRPATVSLSVASDTEDPRLVPGEIVRILIERRRNPIEVHVAPVRLRLAAGATERVTFTVPERFSLSGPTSVLLTIEGAIAVAPTQVVLNEMMRATSASVSMTPGSAVGMEPRSSTAAISLRAISDTEDPRLIPDDVIRILIGESPEIRVKVRVYLEGALP